jgi:hypothetical protein
VPTLRVVRRPSLATVIASLALFVALGGPAHAARFIDGKLLRKGSVTSAAVKDRSLKVRDLGRPAVRTLQRTPNSSVTEAKLANRSVTPGKLANGAVSSAALADRAVAAADLGLGAVRSEHVADGALRAVDFSRFRGRFRAQIGPIPFGRCWSGEFAGLAPELAGADIRDDLMLVSPDDRWVERRVTFTVRASSNRSRFVLAACNVGIPVDGVGDADVPQHEVSFSYAIIDV